jgi:glycosyltransferase involved in cell wall biosynthesis
VLSTRAEQSGSVAVLEALQRGLPIVATGVDGLLEDLTDGVDALLVPPENVAALAAALRRLLDDATLRQRLGAAARRTFERRFSSAAFAGDLRRLYSDLGLRVMDTGSGSRPDHL